MDARLDWTRSYIDRAKMLQQPDASSNVESIKPEHSDSEDSDYDTSRPIKNTPQAPIVDKPLCLRDYVQSQQLLRRVAGQLQASEDWPDY